MAMNEAELEYVVDALQDLLGAGVTGVWQPRRDRVVVGLGDARLLIVPRGPFARVHTVTGRPRNPSNPFSFQGACRAHLRGPLTALVRVEGDRIVDLHFGQHRLHVRLTGRRGGLWLLHEDTVLAAYNGPATPALPALAAPPLATTRNKTPRFEPTHGEDWDRAARRHFGRLEAEARRVERRVLLARRLRTQLGRDVRLRDALYRDLEKSERAEHVRRQADAVASSLHTLRKGIARALLADPWSPGQEIAVELDPAKSPADNMGQLYGRARRLDRMGERVLDHIERVESRLRTVEAALVLVEDADEDTLDQLEALAPVSRRQGASPADLPWWTWLGPVGQTVLVGRNAAGNRRLTFQKARGDDYWFHLRGKPGAHVLLPMTKGRSPDLPTLLAAAQIVLLHAKIPEGAQADVQYTRARSVRSIKGAADGLVQVHDEKVLRVARDDSALVGWRREGEGQFDASGLEGLTRAPVPERSGPE